MKLSHERFHEWFGTECDDTCPHDRRLPRAVVRQYPPWYWRFILIPIREHVWYPIKAWWHFR